MHPGAPRGLRPEPWPLDEPRPPEQDAPPLLLVVFTVCAILAVLLFVMWDVTAPEPTTVVTIPGSVYVVDPPVTVAP